MAEEFAARIPDEDFVQQNLGGRQWACSTIPIRDPARFQRATAPWRLCLPKERWRRREVTLPFPLPRDDPGSSRSRSSIGFASSGPRGRRSMQRMRSGAPKVRGAAPSFAWRNESIAPASVRLEDGCLICSATRRNGPRARTPTGNRSFEASHDVSFTTRGWKMVPLPGLAPGIQPSHGCVMCFFTTGREAGPACTGPAN